MDVFADVYAVTGKSHLLVKDTGERSDWLVEMTIGLGCFLDMG